LDRLSSQEVVVMFLGLGILLALARSLGELVKRLNQPAVVGEILAGIVLGPTVLGKLAPSWAQFIFPSQGSNAVVLDGFATVSISFSPVGRDGGQSFDGLETE
jgi:Kef-type K+ transport system membrane component KefB